MSYKTDCKDHWCEHYGSEKCSQCKEKENARDRPDLRVILKRRADALMELDKNPDKGQEKSQNKSQGQERQGQER